MTISHSTPLRAFHFNIDPSCLFYSRVQWCVCVCVCIIIWTLESRRKLCQVFDCWQGEKTAVYILVWKKPKRLTFCRVQQCAERPSTRKHTLSALRCEILKTLRSMAKLLLLPLFIGPKVFNGRTQPKLNALHLLPFPSSPLPFSTSLRITSKPA